MLSVSTIIAKWLERSHNKTQYHKRSNTEMTQWFIPWFGQVQNLPTPRCGVPTDESCTQLLSSDPMINLSTTVLCFSFLIAFARNLHNLESLALTLEVHKEAQSKGEKQHTQIHSKSAHTRPRIELTRLSQSSHLEQSSNHLETQTNAQRLSVDDQECSKVACVSPPCA